MDSDFFLFGLYNICGTKRRLGTLSDTVFALWNCIATMANRNLEYTHRDYADMHLIYGETRRVSNRGNVTYNARLAARLYSERYPGRNPTTYEVILRVVNAYREGRLPGTGHSEGRPRTVDDEVVLQQVRAEPGTSVRIIERRTGVSKSSLQRVLKRHKYHPYHIQRVQTLLTSDYALRVEFCHEMIQKWRANPNFFNEVLWSDESACKRDGYINLHNIHSWQLTNPHEEREYGSQHQFKINLWTGIFNREIIGPVELPAILNGRNYLEFLQNELPLVLEDTPLELRCRMWFQQDGCPAHYARSVREHLNSTFPGRWIGRLGSILWPPRSPDLNPLDFFYWGCLKDKIYAKPIRSEDELRERVFEAARTISEISLRKLSRNFIRRCHLCIRVRGRQFEHLM